LFIGLDNDVLKTRVNTTAVGRYRKNELSFLELDLFKWTRRLNDDNLTVDSAEKNFANLDK